jgi:hypothetical protein
MKKSNFALRLQPSLMEEARKVANAEGVAVNQLINVAVAEKVSALRTEDYLRNARPRATSRRRFGCSSAPARATHQYPATNYPGECRAGVVKCPFTCSQQSC